VRASLAGPDGGARFTVRLPVVRGAAALGPSPAARTPARAQRVLVVEDNDDAREMLAALLRLLGHEVFEAGTGAAALDPARDHPPAVVIMDIGLPDLDGYEVARRLRQRLGADVRLVALSGYGQPQDRARASGAGFDEHLVKPVDPVMLDEVIQGGSAGAAPTAASARDRIVGR
jgi:CheY-like chemotaxis protein